MYFLGATLTSWVNNSVDRIFVSSKAIYTGPKAIRGGIPLVFPQFGPKGPLPQHGFARVSKWTWGGIVEQSSYKIQVSFSIGKLNRIRARCNTERSSREMELFVQVGVLGHTVCFSTNFGINRYK